jgi:hypothetical protein
MATEKMPELEQEAEFYYFDESLGFNFLWKHQDVVKENEKADFDIFAFVEDDVFLSEDNLDYFVEHSKTLRETELYPGLISYETWPDGDFLHSMSLESWRYGKPIKVNGKDYWTVNEDNRMLPNIHQCCLLLTKERFDYLISNDLFYVTPKQYRWGKRQRVLGPRESATNWMCCLYYYKAWALNDLKRALVHHCDHFCTHPVGPEVNNFLEAIA